MHAPILPGCSCGQKNCSTQKLWVFGFYGEHRGDIHITHYSCLACRRQAMVFRLTPSKAFFVIDDQTRRLLLTENEERIRRALKLSYDNPSVLANELLGLTIHRIADNKWEEQKPTPTISRKLVTEFAESPVRHLIALPNHDECLVAATF